MSGTAEGTAKGTAKRDFDFIWWISPKEGPLYDDRLMSEFRQSHPRDAHLLQDALDAKIHATIKGSCAGIVIGGLICVMLKSRLTRTLPTGYTAAQLFVRTMPTSAVCITTCSALGAYVGDNWVKNPPKAGAKFHHWLQNRASAHEY